MESGKQTWEDLLRLMQEFYRSNPTATLNDARVRVAAEPIIKRNELTFGDARRIDEVLFGEQKNTHWAEAFKFPAEMASSLSQGKIVLQPMLACSPLLLQISSKQSERKQKFVE